MKKSSRYALLVFGIMVLSATFSRAADLPPNPFRDTPYYQHLDQLQKSEGVKVLEEIHKSLQEDPNSINTIAIWLQDNSIGFFKAGKDMSTYNSLYTMAYSDVIGSMALALKQQGKTEEYQNLEQTSLFALYNYSILALTDVARCSDVSAGSEIMPTIASRFKNMKDAYNFTSSDMLHKFGDLSLSVEERAASRPPNKALCSRGLAKMSDEMKQPGTQTKEVDNPGALGGKSKQIVPPPGYEYQPTYVSDADWAKKRSEIRAEIPKGWEKLYQQAQSAK